MPISFQWNETIKYRFKSFYQGRNSWYLHILVTHKPKEKYECLLDESKIMGLWSRIKSNCGCSKRRENSAVNLDDSMTSNPYDNMYSIIRTPDPEPVQGILWEKFPDFHNIWSSSQTKAIANDSAEKEKESKRNWKHGIYRRSKWISNDRIPSTQPSWKNYFKS